MVIITMDLMSFLFYLMKTSFPNHAIFLYMKLYNKPGQILFAVLLLLFGFQASAQKNIVSSFETEMDYAFGGGAYGLFAKANHQ